MTDPTWENEPLPDGVERYGSTTGYPVGKSMTKAEVGLAGWFADKVATESRHPRAVLDEIEAMGFEPETGALTVTLKDPTREGAPISFRFVPDVSRR